LWARGLGENKNASGRSDDELRHTAGKVARGLAKEAAEREWRVFLTAKFDRTWKAMIRFRAKVGAVRFRKLMTELPSTIESIGSSDQRGVAEFFVLPGAKRRGVRGRNGGNAREGERPRCVLGEVD